MKSSLAKRVFLININRYLIFYKVKNLDEKNLSTFNKFLFRSYIQKKQFLNGHSNIIIHRKNYDKSQKS